VAARQLLLEFSEFDPNHVLADVHEIRRYNSQRFEMEQLTAVSYEDPSRMICAGFKDVGNRDFWVRGHMPGMPIMPGVIMCEAAAQLSSYMVQKHGLLGGNVVGLGGLEEIRFRDPVCPGDRFVIVVRQEKLRPGRMVICQFQGFVRQTLVVEGLIKGVPLPLEISKADPQTTTS
jgi:3-hydroxyacyl-[acyl-carrier-protein] dehydratase